MTTKKNRLSFTMTAVIVLSATLLIVTGIISAVLFSQSGDGMRTLINERMLDISNTAAAMMDGDALTGMTKDDAGSPAYEKGMQTLRTFYDNIELEYIYCVYDRGNGLYVFGLDPSDEPGNFDDPIVTTPALVEAFRGVSGVDKEAYEDEWGVFYSSYSPVFNSAGEVACVVAVDFDANWYNNRLAQEVWIVLAVMFVALVAGIGVTLMVTGQVQKQLRTVNQEAGELGHDVEQLARQISMDSGGDSDEDPGGDGRIRSTRKSDIDAIRQRLHKTQDRLKEYIAYTRAQARRDLMTGAGNRNAYLEKVDALNVRIADGSAAFAIGIFDINNLKQINDLYGHETGDGIIVQAAGVLAEVFGRDNIFRIGGDEFIAVVDGADEDGISRMSAQLQEALVQANRQPVHPEAELALSKGFAVFDPQMDTSFLAIFRRADQGMYSNKESFYRSEGVRRKLANVNSSAARNRARMQYIADHLEEAIAEGRIRAWLQPIVRMVNNRICDEEALARWNDPEQGMISPAEFIPALEEARLAYKLDLHMVEEVAHFLQQKMKDGIPLAPVSVNLSRTDFDACDMVEEITKRMDSAGVSRDLLRIEITESVIGSDFDFMKRQIERFGERGFKVWMDDFGSGYSSLDLLQSIHFDTIKLDMRFMREFDGSDRSRIILTELISMAINLGTNTIVEGVETEEQVRFLREIGAGKLQGYFFSPPVSQEKLMEKRRTGDIRIGLENPGETEYYNSVSKVNLQDPSMITKAEALEDYSGYFHTLPMAVLEVGKDDAIIIRVNRSYREFLKRYIGFDMEEGQQVTMSITNRKDRSLFMEAVARCRDTGNWEILRETLKDGETIQSFVRPIARNPVTGKSAVALIVLAVV